MGSRREIRVFAAVGRPLGWGRALSRSVAGAAARLARDEQGQATLEYILILAATVVGAGLMNRKILQVVDTGILKLGGQLEKDLKTGRAPLSVWQN